MVKLPTDVNHQPGDNNNNPLVITNDPGERDGGHWDKKTNNDATGETVQSVVPITT